MENETLSDYENGLRIFARMIARAYRQELAEKRNLPEGHGCQSGETASVKPQKLSLNIEKDQANGSD